MSKQDWNSFRLEFTQHRNVKSFYIAQIEQRPGENNRKANSQTLPVLQLVFAFLLHSNLFQTKTHDGPLARHSRSESQYTVSVGLARSLHQNPTNTANTSQSRVSKRLQTSEVYVYTELESPSLQVKLNLASYPNFPTSVHFFGARRGLSNARGKSILKGTVMPCHSV